jgi:hypothetical protein
MAKAAASTMVDRGSAVTAADACGIGATRLAAEARTAVWLECMSQAAAAPTERPKASRARRLRMVPVSLLLIADHLQ